MNPLTPSDVDIISGSSQSERRRRRRILKSEERHAFWQGDGRKEVERKKGKKREREEANG